MPAVQENAVLPRNVDTTPDIISHIPASETAGVTKGGLLSALRHGHLPHDSRSRTLDIGRTLIVACRGRAAIHSPIVIGVDASAEMSS